MAVQAALAAVILFTYNWLAIGLGVASLGLVLIYPFAKRFTWWPQAFLGLAFNWGAVLVYAAHAGEVRLPAVLLYGAGIAWTLFYDTIYAHQDREDDALIGVKSTARLFGDNCAGVAARVHGGGGGADGGGGDHGGDSAQQSAGADPGFGRGLGLWLAYGLAVARPEHRRSGAMPQIVSFQPRCGADCCAVSCRCGFPLIDPGCGRALCRPKPAGCRGLSPC